MRLVTANVSTLIVLLIATAALAQAPAVAPLYKLRVTVDRPAAIYKLGEEATFGVELLDSDQPAAGVELTYTLSVDGFKTLSTGKLTSSAQPLSVKGTLDEPGFLRLTVMHKPQGKAPIIGLAAAGFDPTAIKPSLPPPDDFDEFWNDQKRQLAAVPLNPRMTPADSQISTVECFDLQVDCLGGKPVSGYFARPKIRQPKSMPAVLFVHGAGVRTAGLGSAMTQAHRGQCLALDINAHGIPNGQPAAFYTSLNNGELKQYAHQGRESRETIYFRGMYLRLIRAIDFLCSQPEWDGKEVIVRGASQGGGQALAAAGLDARVTAFYAGVPALCDHSGNVVGRIAGWPYIVPLDVDRKPNAQVLQAARYIDVVNFAMRTKADAFVTVGFIDTTCPPTSIYAAYNCLTGPKEILHGVSIGHVEWPASIERADRLVIEHVARAKGTK